MDLWGGYRDGVEKLPWEQDTLVTVFSSTKGLSSTTIPVAHARGWLDVEAPVARYWPEFAQNGKSAITIRQLLSHQAGLAVLDRQLTLADVADPDRLASILAVQAPAWEPGTRHGYHAMTLGFYESELLRRIQLHTYDTGHGTVSQRTRLTANQSSILERLGLPEPPRYYDFAPLND